MTIWKGKTFLYTIPTKYYLLAISFDLLTRDLSYDIGVVFEILENSLDSCNLLTDKPTGNKSRLT